MANIDKVWDDSEPWEIVERNGKKDLRAVSSTELVKQRIRRLVTQSKGELFHHPNLGGGLSEWRNRATNEINLVRLQNSIDNLLRSIPWVDKFKTDITQDNVGGIFVVIQATVNGEAVTIDGITVI